MSTGMLLILLFSYCLLDILYGVLKGKIRKGIDGSRKP